MQFSAHALDFAANYMFRRTKIVATLGPATDDPKVLDKLIEAGVDIDFPTNRINYETDKPYQIHFTVGFGF